MGSSPLARGLRVWVREWFPAWGIIPARAGFTDRRARQVRGPADHPRSRGVYLGPAAHGAPTRGSSPLARGLLGDRHVDGGQGGIIPARAGFTRRSLLGGPRRPDHPRSRGVYARLREELAAEIGSSPLARGLLWVIVTAWCAIRIIPARAGFTGPGSAAGARGQDHPRSRGVYRPRRGAHAAARGSSPLARGLHVDELRAGLTTGIIPARAGFTAWSHPGAGAGEDHPRSRGVYA